MTIRTITGTVEYADGAIPENSRAEFYLSGIHIDDVAIAHSAVYAPLDGSGGISGARTGATMLTYGWVEP